MTLLSILSSCLLNVRDFFSALEFMKKKERKNSLLMRAWTRIETCLNCLGSNLFWRSSQTILLKCFHEIFFKMLTFNTMVWKLQKKLVKIQRHNNIRPLTEFISTQCAESRLQSSKMIMRFFLSLPRREFRTGEWRRETKLCIPSTLFTDLIFWQPQIKSWFKSLHWSFLYCK